MQSRGPALDFLAMPHAELARYHAGEDFEVVSELAGLGTTAVTFDAELSAGTYRLVFDNTVRGEADPVAELVADFEWSVRPA